MRLLTLHTFEATHASAGIPRSTSTKQETRILNVLKTIYCSDRGLCTLRFDIRVSGFHGIKQSLLSASRQLFDTPWVRKDERNLTFYTWQNMNLRMPEERTTILKSGGHHSAVLGPAS